MSKQFKSNYTSSPNWRLFYLVVILGILSLGIILRQSSLHEQANTVYQNGEFSVSSITMSGTISGNTFTGKNVSYSLVDGLPMVEGDIILSLDGQGMQTAGTGVPVKDRRWKNGLVPYAIDPNLPDQFRIHDAIAHWTAKTPIRFVLRDASNASQYPDYVYFRPSTGCSSYVGRIGGNQPINLAQGCSTGATIHEIGHAVGAWHEQSRIDRDQYITVHFENIMPEAIFNFNQHISDGEDIGIYDYDSIMHYPRWAFSKNGKDTIVPKQNVEIGQRYVLSYGDIAAVVHMYRDIIQEPVGE